jgi:molecular chaperone GrpE
VKKNKKNADTFENVEEVRESKEIKEIDINEKKDPEILEPETNISDTSQGSGSARAAEGKSLCDVCSELSDRLLRQAAEYDNYRKRTAKERLDLVPEITSGNVAAILPILDNVERALAAECSDPNYKKGIEMIHESFLAVLTNLGVEEIVSEDFDPAVHQAVQHVESDELESGKVAQVFQKGYKIGTRIVRFAMVAIVK